jgi:hypothetical protein
LSVRILCRNPHHRKTSLSRRDAMVPRVAFGIGKALIHLKNMSVATSMKLLPRIDLEYWPIRSSPTVSHGFWGRRARGGPGAIGHPPFAVAQVVQVCICFWTSRRGSGEKNSSRTALVFWLFQGGLLVHPHDGLAGFSFRISCGTYRRGSFSAS